MTSKTSRIARCREMRRALLALLIGAATHAAGAADSSPGTRAASDWRRLNRQAAAQARAHDHAGLHETLVALAPSMPGSPTITYNLAATAARLGHPDEALGHLRQLAQAGLQYDLAKDDDFDALAADPAFIALRDRLARNGEPIGASRRLATIAGEDTIPESLAWDASARRLFVSSVRHCEVRVPDDPRQPHGHERRFARVPASAFALAVDRKRGRLWVTIATVAQGDGCGEGAAKDERTALLALDLRSGRVVQRIDSALPGVLGDMLLAGDGTVFVTESVHGAVLRLLPGAKKFERLDPPGEFISPQMPAFGADERTLLVPDHARGIAAIDLATPSSPLRWLPNGPGVFTAGIDGFARVADGFLAVQNGTAPPRVIRFSADFSRQQVLESGTPGLGEPTHAIVVDGRTWFISDVGWDRFDDDGHRKPALPAARSELREVVVR